ncbi:MAG: hypothetical protein J0I47_08715 [Sphingomonas sp.]|uniref:hypothetical protein n=1 Tax=Sphingomonas sp. TaxID=28214 RepID=UPI001AC5632B|nr:hypothetical protein [Sphingomonas sp.]MBN8808302.1 hypothetical protein [Sphingomonas sp.]
MTIASGPPVVAAPARPQGSVVPSYHRTLKHSRFAISIGSRRIAFERVQDRYTMLTGAEGQTGARAVPGKVLIGVASVGLFLTYVALLPAPAPATSYSATLAIPDRPAAAPERHAPRLSHTHRPAHVAAAPAEAMPAGDAPAAVLAGTTDATLDSASASPDIVDVPASDGERSLEVLGAERTVGGKLCRDVQLFSRDAAGKVSVEPSLRCGKR